ncbi:MAG: serpin family protein [Dehalococcoidales bacterium]|nr:serpin family protein [Dehalococcoidales bacterium]
MKRLLFLMLAIVMIVGLIGCSQPASAEVLKSDKDRITSPVVNSSDMKTLVNGNSEFAFDLYQALKKEDGNIFYSPYSISLALAMTYGGARGETAKQMADTLHYLLPQSALHPAFNSLDIELGKRGEGGKGKDSKGFRLNVVNAIWGQKDYRFLSAYLDLLAENYGAGLRILDFKSAPEQSRMTINKWVSDQTEDRIKDLVPEGSINPLTRLVLTNAIYFNAAWKLPFKPEATTDGPFHLINGDDVTVPMMKQTEYFGYAKSGNYLAVELPYDGDELSMVILMNETGKFGDFENTLKLSTVKAIIGDLKNTRVALTMPKFEFESEFGLKETLIGMGMEEPFRDSADFSGMSKESDLHIDDVVHKAFVSVDEAGTEAAAASAVIVGTTSMPPEPVTVTLDRPFVFLIRDIQTGAILFIGRVMNPGV